MTTMAQNPEDGGCLVREAWINWARRHPNPKPSWLIPWEALSESEKEADRVIWHEIVAPYVTMITQLVAENAELRKQAQKVRVYREALDEIGTEAASVLDEGHIRDWAEGGRLGDVLIGIKDIVATIYAQEKIAQES